MHLISHRGNLTRSNIELENSFEYILSAINQGFDVEIDLRFIDGNWWLGHDTPQYLINLRSLEPFKNKLWCHCKNFQALEEFQNTNFNYFWHQNDDHTLTSKGFIWTYPGKNQGTSNIMVMPELYTDLSNPDLKNFAGICSDYILELKNNFIKS
jgi:hypothetical protein